jgi:micrococcal nuclease
MYQYKAIIQKVVDGDTLEISIDLGLSVWIHDEKIRLYGIDTPEVFGVKKGTPEWELGMKASDFVKSILKEKDEIIIQTIKDKQEKYGRYLGLVYLKVSAEIISGLADIRSIDDYFCLNDIMVRKGLAKVYML